MDNRKQIANMPPKLSHLRWRVLPACNNDFGDKFVPAKRHFRPDTVDSQRGEVEWDGRNLYRDKWNCHFEWKILPAKQMVAGRPA